MVQCTKRVQNKALRGRFSTTDQRLLRNQLKRLVSRTWQTPALKLEAVATAIATTTCLHALTNRSRIRLTFDPLIPVRQKKFTLRRVRSRSLEVRLEQSNGKTARKVVFLPTCPR